MCCHEVACVRATWHTRACVYTLVIRVLSIHKWIFANPLRPLPLYTHVFASISVMWDYFSLFLCASDVAISGACDRVNHHDRQFSLKEGGMCRVMVSNQIILK